MRFYFSNLIIQNVIFNACFYAEFFVGRYFIFGGVFDGTIEFLKIIWSNGRNIVIFVIYLLQFGRIRDQAISSQ